jgi:1,2-diacylglycerol-3-alpha-glucose alpha-1,2-glucosyltransferase
VSALRDVIDGKIDKREAGYKVAESRDIHNIAHQLEAAYQKVLSL